MPPALICFSHLRWDFVYQRPQHLLERLTAHYRAFFMEEPLFDAPRPYLDRQLRKGVTLLVPHLPQGITQSEADRLQEQLLQALLIEEDLTDYVFWYYTPMAMAFTEAFRPQLTVYDCMDELSHFDFAPPELLPREQQLFERADVVFTGGQSLYLEKKNRHPNVHAFPSSIDASHFRQARRPMPAPPDQAALPAGPKLGFYGVIDERFDYGLIGEIAAARPDWQLVLIGPVVKIDPAVLPHGHNIHYLGPKTYAQLPAYLSGWDIALIPFLLNEATRFISPTKTPEYLAAGCPVISTPIRDVVYPYGQQGLVKVAADAPAFVNFADDLLSSGPQPQWLEKVDAFLAGTCWDLTVSQMEKQLRAALHQKTEVHV